MQTFCLAHPGQVGQRETIGACASAIDSTAKIILDCLSRRRNAKIETVRFWQRHILFARHCKFLKAGKSRNKNIKQWGYAQGLIYFSPFLFDPWNGPQSFRRSYSAVTY